MLNPVAKKWVEALRSGKYIQGKQFLKTPEGTYCCMGVLTELAVEAGVIPEFTSDPDTSLPNKVPPPEVVSWAKLRTGIGYVSYGRCLTGLNDNGKTFSEIADLIESEPAGLFVEAS